MLLFTLREGRKKKTQERERDLSVFFSFWLRNVVLIKSSRAHSARHEFISHSHSLPCHHHRQEETRTLIRDSLSLSLCVLVVVVVVCFHFSPTKVGGRYKNKNSLPSSLSLVWTKVYAHHRLKCYNCVIKGLHEYFIRIVSIFLSSSPRVVSSSSIRERERERERERKRKKEKSAQKRRTKILYLQNTRNVEKKQVVATAFLPRLERER